MQVNIPDIKIDGVTKHKTVDVTILFCTTVFLSAESAKIPSDLKNIEGHGHKYLILSDDDYLKLDKVNAAVTKPKHPGAFTATNTAQTCKVPKRFNGMLHPPKIQNWSQRIPRKIV